MKLISSGYRRNDPLDTAQGPVVHYGNQGNYSKSRVILPVERLTRGKLENRLIDAFVKRIFGYVSTAALQVSQQTLQKSHDFELEPAFPPVASGMGRR